MQQVGAGTWPAAEGGAALDRRRVSAIAASPPDLQRTLTRRAFFKDCLASAKPPAEPPPLRDVGATRTELGLASAARRAAATHPRRVRARRAAQAAHGVLAPLFFRQSQGHAVRRAVQVRRVLCGGAGSQAGATVPGAAAAVQLQVGQRARPRTQHHAASGCTPAARRRRHPS